ncbi:MAG: putative RNA methyltransferase [Vicinamibacterales bacterium]
MPPPHASCSPPLACSVRACGQPLERTSQTWACPAGHSFDIARSGYVNLLQPQDRRSAHAGDSPAAIEARQHLIAAGVGVGLREMAIDLIAGLALGRSPVVLELGCASGDLLGRLGERTASCTVGIDLAASAVARAARAFPAGTWVVANADRRLPIRDASVSVVLSVHARRNPEECARVLAPDRPLVVIVPAADDLIELREAVFGQRIEHPRAERLAEEHAPYFALVSRSEHRERVLLPVDQLDHLLTGTYRAGRTTAATARASLEPMTVTLASDILVFQVRDQAGSTESGSLARR